MNEIQRSAKTRKKLKKSNNNIQTDAKEMQGTPRHGKKCNDIKEVKETQRHEKKQNKSEKRNRMQSEATKCNKCKQMHHECKEMQTNETNIEKREDMHRKATT